MLIFEVFFFPFSISLVCHAMNMKQLQILTLLFIKKEYFGQLKDKGRGKRLGSVG